MKKILSLLITFALLLTSFPGLAYASDTAVEAVSAPDAAESAADIENARTLLSSVGVVPGFSNVYTEPVTRADFITALMAVFKFNAVTAGETPFYDVNASDSFNASVYQALNLGIISEAQYFRPYDAITVSEAAKIIVVALGYELHAQAKGGWPYGYYTVADSLDLFTGFNASADMALSSSQGYLILANMLEADMKVMDALVADGEELYADYGEVSNLLAIYYDWYPIQGVVTANDSTHIYNTADAQSEGFVLIGDEKYRCSVATILGTYVEGYACKDGAIPTVKYLRYDEDTVFTLYPQNNPSFDGGKVTYVNDADVEKDITLNSLCAAIYNGRAYPDVTADDFDIQVGSITFVNSDSDSDYDTVIIYNGEIHYADISNSETGTLVDNFDGTKINLKDEKYKVFTNGVHTPDASVSAGTVFEYYPAKDAAYAEIHPLTESVKGTINEASADSIYLDSVPYRYTDYFKARYGNNSKLGTTNTFVLTRSGAVAAIMSVSSSSGSIGYGYKFAAKSGLDSEYRMKLLNQDGSHLELTFADKVRINDEVTATSDNIAAYFKKYVPDYDTAGTLMRYRTDEQGYVSSVYLPSAAEASQLDNIYDPTMDSPDVLKTYPVSATDGSGKIYYKSFGIFVPHFSISDDTLIFIANPNEDLDDESRYTIGSMLSWSNDDQLIDTAIMPYNVNRGGRAQILVYRGAPTSELAAESKGGVIDSISTSYDSHGEKALKLVIASGSDYVVAYIAENDELYSSAVSDLSFGDYIMFSIDDYSTILNYRKDFDYSDRNVIYQVQGSKDNSNLVYYYGYLGTLDDTSISIDVKSSGSSTKSGRIITNTDLKQVWLVNPKDKAVSGISNTKISEYMEQDYEILVRTRYGNALAIYIYDKQ